MTDPITSNSSSLRDYLASRDAPCPHCSYNLRGLTSDRCPECSQPLALQIALAEPRMGALLTCVLSLASAGGLFFLGLLIVLAICLKQSPPRGTEFWLLIVYPAFASLVCLPACGFLVTKFGRRWLRTRSTLALRLAVCGCVGVSLFLVVVWAIWAVAEI